MIERLKAIWNVAGFAASMMLVWGAVVLAIHALFS
jgi:hypothetical protein